LSDYQVRDLNDEINKLMGQKYHWERRIKELGGADYTVKKKKKKKKKKRKQSIAYLCKLNLIFDVYIEICT
jgi:hypothetical protein